MTSYDWQSFDLHYYYHAPLADVWRAWATPNGLCTFFVEECIGSNPDGTAHDGDEPFVVDGRYEWRWRQDFSGQGTILAVEPQKRLSYTFGAEMKVDIRFLDTGSGIRVHLHQADIPNTEAGRVDGHLNCRSCWIFFMTNLVSILQNGVDLRDEDPNRVASMEVNYIPAEER